MLILFFKTHIKRRVDMITLFSFCLNSTCGVAYLTMWSDGP